MGGDGAAQAMSMNSLSHKITLQNDVGWVENETLTRHSSIGLGLVLGSPRNGFGFVWADIRPQAQTLNDRIIPQQMGYGFVRVQNFGT